MRSQHLNGILAEYRPSMRLDVLVDGQKMYSTSVIEMMFQLTQPNGPETLVQIFDRSSCIIRERGDWDSAPWTEWLEIDMR